MRSAILLLACFAMASPGHCKKLPDSAPLPTPRPETAPFKKGPPATRPRVLSDDETKCRRQLRLLGVAFKDTAPIKDAAGCHVPAPLIASNLADGLTLEPPAMLNCHTARALALFFNGKAQDIAKKHFGSEIAVIHQNSAYVCRPRNGTQTLSEHAFANALDIAAFTLSDGRRVTVALEDEKSVIAKFLQAMGEAMCGPFKTVLGPGSNADHADHFHLDMKQRRNDFAYCR